MDTIKFYLYVFIIKVLYFLYITDQRFCLWLHLNTPFAVRCNQPTTKLETFWWGQLALWSRIPPLKASTYFFICYNSCHSCIYFKMSVYFKEIRERYNSHNSYVSTRIMSAYTDIFLLHIGSVTRLGRKMLFSSV